MLNVCVLIVTSYGKTDHSRNFMKSAFLVRIDAEFYVEFKGQRIRLKKAS